MIINRDRFIHKGMGKQLRFYFVQNVCSGFLAILSSRNLFNVNDNQLSVCIYIYIYMYLIHKMITFILTLSTNIWSIVNLLISSNYIFPSMGNPGQPGACKIFIEHSFIKQIGRSWLTFKYKISFLQCIHQDDQLISYPSMPFLFQIGAHISYLHKSS